MNGRISIFYMKTPLKEIHILATDELFRNVRIGSFQNGSLSPLRCAGINIRKYPEPEISVQ
jgi:hypothetical protein